MVGNVDKLKGKIVEKGYSRQQLADEIGISLSTLRRKINNPNAEFFVGESVKIKEKLGLTNEEYLEIFIN